MRTGPTSFAIDQNYPNPFNPETKIGFRVPGPGSTRITLAVYDLLGREVAVLVDEEKTSGSYELTYNASNLASGVYTYRLSAGNFTQARKMMVLK